MKTAVATGSQPLAAGVYYLLSDLLYRSTALTNASGSIVEAYDTDAYGNTLIYSGPGTDGLWFTNDDVTSLQPACEYLFTGRQYDPETQIYFYRARYYHPQLGRFVSRDPIEYMDDMNLYAYCGGRPTGELDPHGLDAKFWEFLKCYDACLNNNNPLGAVGRYILDALASSNALRIPIPISKTLLVDFAKNVLNDDKLAGLIKARAALPGAHEMGSLQKFVRIAIRSGKGAEAANYFSKVAKATGVIAALAAVADLAVHTHCIAYCCVLSSNRIRYDPKQDNFIRDWVKEWFNK